MIKIDTIMSRQVHTVNMDDSLKTVKQVFDSSSFHHLLVIEHGQLWGIISDRDLLKAISPKVDTVAATDKDLATLNKRAHQIMSHNPIMLDREATVNDAIKVFHDNKISCIPVVDDNKKPIGIISWRDIIELLYSRMKH